MKPKQHNPTVAGDVYKHGVVVSGIFFIVNVIVTT